MGGGVLKLAAYLYQVSKLKCVELNLISIIRLNDTHSVNSALPPTVSSSNCGILCDYGNEVG